MNKKQQAHQSIERLFAEPFTPQWMAGQEEAELHALNELVTTGVDQKWRQEAEESRRRIADKYPSKKRIEDWG